VLTQQVESENRNGRLDAAATLFKKKKNMLPRRIFLERSMLHLRNPQPSHSSGCVFIKNSDFGQIYQILSSNPGSLLVRRFEVIREYCHRVISTAMEIYYLL
jgi:hypothetical protein